MSLLLIAGLALVMGMILLCMGLSFIDFGLSSLAIGDSYNADSYNYYQNPLNRLGSKYFYYRPKGAVVVSKKQWAAIEKNIGVKIGEAKEVGRTIGYKEAIIDIRFKVKEEKAKAFPSSPYAVLDVESKMPLNEIEEKFVYLYGIYDPKNFISLDPAFTELAEIRRAQVKRAWNQINLGIKPVSISAGDI